MSYRCAKVSVVRVAVANASTSPRYGGRNARARPSRSCSARCRGAVPRRVTLRAPGVQRGRPPREIYGWRNKSRLPRQPGYDVRRFYVSCMSARDFAHRDVSIPLNFADIMTPINSAERSSLLSDVSTPRTIILGVMRYTMGGSAMSSPDTSKLDRPPNFSTVGISERAEKKS